MSDQIIAQIKKTLGIPNYIDMRNHNYFMLVCREVVIFVVYLIL